MASPSHHVIIAGSTGGVGRRCVYYALKHTSVGSVTALMRGLEKEASFFGLDLSKPEDKAAFETKLKQKVVDFSSAESLNRAAEHHTAGISCVGVYTDAVSDWKDFMNREHTPNIAVARAAAAAGVKRWGYLSGQGVSQPKEGTASKPFLQPSFSFVKGSIERDLAAIDGFESTTSVRPGMILKRGDQPRYKGISGWLEAKANNWQWVANSSFAVTADDIAKALVQSVVGTGTPPPNEVLENDDIKRRAKEFEAASPL